MPSPGSSTGTVAAPDEGTREPAQSSGSAHWSTARIWLLRIGVLLWLGTVMIGYIPQWLPFLGQNVDRLFDPQRLSAYIRLITGHE